MDMNNQAWAPPRVKQRDSQRAKVYKAENAVMKPHVTPLPTMADVEGFVRKVWTSQRVMEAWPRAAGRHSGWSGFIPKVKDGRGRRNSCANGGMSISIVLPHRNDWIVCHELAHIVIHRELGWNVAGHGWQFCSVYLKLVLWFMGREAHDALKKSFKLHKVKFYPPRKKRELSQEQKAQLVLRLGRNLTEQSVRELVQIARDLPAA